MAGSFRLYAEPAGDLQLTVRPRLESWDAVGHPSQVALGQFVDHVEAVLAPVRSVDKPWAVLLVVGLSESVQLTSGGHDLDNYAFPIARRLGHAAIASMHVHKRRGTSLIGLETALPTAEPDRAGPCARRKLCLGDDEAMEGGARRPGLSGRSAAGTAWSAADASGVPRQPGAQLDHAVEAGDRCPRRHPRAPPATPFLTVRRPGGVARSASDAGRCDWLEGRDRRLVEER